MIYKNKLTRFPPDKTTRYNRFFYPGIITQDEAMKMQEDAGYHPAGYGFYSFASKNDKTTWECSNSCD